jgi:hypothetical protein
MKHKIILGLILLVFALGIFAQGISAAEKPRHRPPLLLPVDAGLAGEEPTASIPPVVLYEGTQPDCEDIHPTVGLERIIQHDQFGATYYDYQSNGSMGRMIAVGSGGHRHFIFHETRGDYITYPRYITYNCKDPLDSWLGPTYADGGEGINAGYPQVGVLHDERPVLVYHRSVQDASWWTTLVVNDSVGGGYFTNLYDIPDKIQGQVSYPPYDRGIWPKMAIAYDVDVDTDYIHIVQTEFTGGMEERAVAYLRCVFQGDNLVCYSPGYGPYIRFPNVPNSSDFDTVAVIDTIMTISAIVVTSPVSRRMAIVYAKNRPHEYDTEVDNDVVYVESMLNANDWLDGSSWPATRHNITDYPSEAMERAYTDVAACYDYSDSLHIVWSAAWYDSVNGLTSHDANLYHWSKENGTTMIADAYWGGTNPNKKCRNIAKMSISALDPVYHPGGDPDSVYLFCIWVQSDSGDNSLGQRSNGDIYAAVSNDGGATWTPRYNLTNTKTPECAPGECLSEHWPSMAENMYDGELHIQYVCDRDAGAIIGDEGEWADNPMMYLHVEELPFEAHCGISYTLTDPPSFTKPPLKVSPDKGSREFSFEVFGLYNLGGNFYITSDHPSVAVHGNSSGYLAPGQSRSVGVTITCPTEEFIDATITINGCAQTEDDTTIELSLYAVCGNDYYECPRDTATFILEDNGKLKLWVCANSMEKVWHKWIEPEEKQQVIFSGGTIVATTTAEGDTVVGRQDYRDVRTGARDTINQVQGYNDYSTKDYLIQKIYVKDTYIWTPYVDPPNDFKWWWIDIHKQVIMFHGLNCPDWKKDVIVKYIWIEFGHPPVWWPGYPLTYEGHRDIYLGHFADVDAPFDDGCIGCNTAGYDEVREMVWLHGFYDDTLPEGHPEYEDFYVGLALTDRDGAVVEPLGMQCVRNDSFLYPQGGWGWLDEELYELAATPGVNIHDPDSVTDRSVVMIAEMTPAGSDTTFEVEYILIEAAVQGDPGLGLEALQAHIDDARDTLIAELNSYEMFDKNWEPPICGDVLPNGTVNSGDVVRLIGYVFLDESEPPWPVECRADVTGNGVIDSGDIVRLIGCCFLGWWCPPMCPDHCYGD